MGSRKTGSIEKPTPVNPSTDTRRITLIILALNEEKNLPHVLRRIPPIVDEIILVDGRSTDNTIAVAQELCPSIRILSQERRGKGDAIRCGIKNATGDIIITLDADGSMAPEEIERFIKPILEGYQFVKGSRFIPGGGTTDMQFYRFLANKAFVFLVNLLYGGRYTDLCYGYNAFEGDSIRNIRIESDGFEIETEINIKALKAKLKIIEVPSREVRRLSGKSQLKSFKDGLSILKTILTNWRHKKTPVAENITCERVTASSENS